METPFGVQIISEPAHTYSDYILLPSSNQDIEPNSVSTKTCIGGDISLRIPIVGANMGHLGGRMAEKLAQLGGIGILSQDFRLKEILKRIKRVKEANPYFHMPIVLSPHDRTADALALMNKRHFDCVIVVDSNDAPVGLATRKDLVKIPIWEQLKNVMKKDLEIVDESISIERASKIMIEKQIHHLPVVNRDKKLLGCMTPLDISLRVHNYKPALDKRDRLLIGVAMGIKPKESIHPLELAQTYIQADVDILVLDVANGYLSKFVKFVSDIRGEVGEKIPIIAGNVADYNGAMRLLEAGCNTVKVGVGPGGACTTRRETGVGVPQKTAVEEALKACQRISQKIEGTKKYVLADGGIRNFYDLAVAVLLGSSGVMIGSLFAGTYESAFETEIIDGQMWKTWRGNASSSAATYRRKEVYGEKYITEDLEHSEGADGMVRVTGSVTHEIFRLVEGLKGCMAYSNSQDLPSFTKKGEKILRLKVKSSPQFSHLSELDLKNLYIKPQPSEVSSRKTVRLETKLTESLELKIPYVALPANFVQKKICTIFAQMGGMGFLSKKKINEPVEHMTKRIKQIKSTSPLYFLPSIQECDEEIGKTIDFINENAFSCVIIVKNFQNDWTPVGIATRGDLFDRPRTDPLYEVVKSNILTVTEGIDLRHASDIMLEKGIHHLPVVDLHGKLVGCITPRDITLRVFYRLEPNTVKGRLRVGASLYAGQGEAVIEDAIALDKAGADMLLLDTDNGYASSYLQMLRKIRQKVNCPVAAAGVSCYEGAMSAFQAGADVIKVGSPNIKIPYLEAICNCARAASKHGKSIISGDYDNIEEPRDANFSLLMGASAVGLRDILAPTFENSVQSVLAPPKSQKKSAPKLIKKSLDGAEYIMEDMGNIDLVCRPQPKIEGSVINVIVRFIGGLRSSCTYSNAFNLQEYQRKAIIGIQGASGYREGNPHAFSCESKKDGLINLLPM